MVTLSSIIVTLIILVVFIILARRFFRRSRRSRNIYHRSKAAKRVATSDAIVAVTAHNDNPDDPLVLVYNRPDIAIQPTYRDNIADRLHRGIIEATETDEIPRFVDAGRIIGVDFTPLATLAVGAIVADHVRRDGVDTIVANAQKIANDPQNVHDPTVIKQMRDQLTAIPERAHISRMTVASNISDEINRLVEVGEISHARANEARRVLQHMIEKGGTCMSYGNRHEADILRDAWGDAMNDETKKANIILGLADAISDGHVVCTNGRIARVLGANSTQVSTADLKAAAYAYAGSIYGGLGENFTANDVADGMRRVDEYVDGLREMPEEQRRLVREECRAVFADLDVDVAPQAPPTMNIPSHVEPMHLQTPETVTPSIPLESISTVSDVVPSPAPDVGSSSTPDMSAPSSDASA